MSDEALIAEILTAATELRTALDVLERTPGVRYDLPHESLDAAREAAETFARLAFDALNEESNL